jgi:hypothetical protein
MKTQSSAFEGLRDQIEATRAAIKDGDDELAVAIDRLSTELGALKMAVELYHPGISRFYAKLRQEARVRTRMGR